jgi:predicted metal-binding membrane protein
MMDAHAIVAARLAPGRAPHRGFFAVMAALFIASVGATIAWCASMSAMDGMAMPGGWTMSMAWMRMPGQTWLGAGAAFLGMWVVMMVGMMLPSLTPMLMRYREAVRDRDGLTTLVGIAYFLVWTAFGVIVFPVGVGLASLEMQEPLLARFVPTAIAFIVVIAGVLQFSAWKARQLVSCRGGLCGSCPLPAAAGTAFRHGLRLGLHCCYCCANLTAILLVVGVMDLRAMAVVTAAITMERLAPAGEQTARVTGAFIVAAGLVLGARAVALL